jgi:hypothetical protein
MRRWGGGRGGHGKTCVATSPASNHGWWSRHGRSSRSGRGSGTCGKSAGPFGYEVGVLLSWCLGVLVSLGLGVDKDPSYA